MTGPVTGADSRARSFLSSACLHAGVATLLLMEVKVRFGAGDSDQGSFARAAAASAKQNKEGRPYQPDDGAGGTYSGVILWPKIDQRVTLVAPLPALGPNPFATRNAAPLSIPFLGAYWFYRAPYVRPPWNSFVTRGSPADIRYRSHDAPLRMEARQNLGTFIATRCCGEILIEILNADRFPDTVDLELRLINTAGARASLSLGRAPVTSTSKHVHEPPPAHEVLTFRIPPRSVPATFDEIAVVFHLRPPRAWASAKIAIEKFVLVPGP